MPTSTEKGVRVRMKPTERENVTALETTFFFFINTVRDKPVEYTVEELAFKLLIKPKFLKFQRLPRKTRNSPNIVFGQISLTRGSLFFQHRI